MAAEHGHSHGHSHAAADDDDAPYGPLGPDLFSAHDASDHEHQIFEYLFPSSETAAASGTRLSLPPESMRQGTARDGPRRPPRLA
jgi:hypothetical protein